MRTEEAPFIYGASFMHAEKGALILPILAIRDMQNVLLGQSIARFGPVLECACRMRLSGCLASDR